ncbi:hypothetical protein JXA32_05085 [Candidatus Sumerlaeota bacterium]|nr:hypothetical protein [Candidatus Sumerlaeota bacterium]
MSAEFDAYDFRRKKNQLAFTVVALVAALTAVYLLGYITDPLIMAIIVIPPCNLIAALWASSDSKEHQASGVFWIVPLLLGAPLILPLYLLVRRKMGVFGALSGVVALLLCGAALGYAAAWVLVNLDWFRGIWEIIRPKDPGTLKF